VKLFFSPASPFVRKVLVSAAERGIADLIEKLPSAAHPINQDRTILAHNPTGKVPTLITTSGEPIYDSRVICEYLDSIGDAPPLHPVPGPDRWHALVLQSAADEMVDAALLARYEVAARPEPLRWSEWSAGQVTKILSTTDDFEARWIDHLRGHLDVGVVATACALGYLDFRFPEINWRSGRSGLAAWYADFAARPSMVATHPGS
jgi:glutathione S-transferase